MAKRQRSIRKIQNSKLAEMFAGGFVIGTRRFFGSRAILSENINAANCQLGFPGIFDFMNTFVLAGSNTTFFSSIMHVFSTGAFSKIGTLIVQSVVVTMIYIKTRSRIHHNSMHCYSFSVGSFPFSSCSVPISSFVVGLPLPLVKIIKKIVINQCEFTLREGDAPSHFSPQAGLCELDNFVSVAWPIHALSAKRSNEPIDRQPLVDLAFSASCHSLFDKGEDGNTVQMERAFPSDASRSKIHSAVACAEAGEEIIRAGSGDQALLIGGFPITDDIFGEHVAELNNQLGDQAGCRRVWQFHENAHDRFECIQLVGGCYFGEPCDLLGELGIADIGDGIKHGESPVVSNPPCYNSHSLRCANTTAVVRAGKVVAHLVGSISCGLFDDLFAFRLGRLHFVLRFGRILEIELNRAQDLAVQRAVIILRALFYSLMKLVIRKSEVCGVHIASLVPLRYFVKPQIMAVAYG